MTTVVLLAMTETEIAWTVLLEAVAVVLPAAVVAVAATILVVLSAAAPLNFDPILISRNHS